MAITSASLNKLTKPFVALVVLTSVSFGAFGLGRATESSIKNPQDAVFKIVTSWQSIDSYCPVACDWDLMQRMVQVTLPAGNYMISGGGLVLNSSGSVARTDCRFVAGSGTVYRAFGQVGLGDGEQGMLTIHSYAKLTDDFTTLKLECGVVDNAASVAFLDASISAIRVDSLRSAEISRPG